MILFIIIQLYMSCAISTKPFKTLSMFCSKNFKPSAVRIMKFTINNLLRRVPPQSYYRHPHDCPSSVNRVAYHSTHDFCNHGSFDDASVISNQSSISKITQTSIPSRPTLLTNTSQILTALQNMNIDPNVLAILQSHSKLLQQLIKTQIAQY